MRVLPIPCLSDNYAYLIVPEGSSLAVVVDPSEADPVRAALSAEGLELAQIWLTHHHWDHVGGVEALVDALHPEAVLGSAYDLEHARIPRQTRGLREGEALSLEGRDVALFDIPGHTLGAIAYVVDGNLFSGDTLFVAGCGRVFEGTMPQMKTSLDKLRDLPGDTRVWCGHEYTVKNLEYARTVEPDNAAIEDALAEAARARASGAPTVPGTIAREREINPFLRCEGAGEFTRLREGKDNF
jgi:hydroxyacylglutathione hydrolase